MKIIAAASAHLPDICRIAAVTWPYAYGDILSAEQIAYMLAMFYSPEILESQMNKGHHFLLAVENGEAVGFAGYERDYNNTGEAKLHKLYVLPGGQGKGAGRLLLQAVIQDARQADLPAIILNVNRYNKAALFYEKHGFSVRREEDIDIGNGYFMNDYVMERRLD